MKNKTRLRLLVITALVFLTILQCQAQKTVRIQFDSKMEVSGKKFAIKDISSGVPVNWDGYNFVVLEFKITTAQRFQLGFTTETGYNEPVSYTHLRAHETDSYLVC